MAFKKIPGAPLCGFASMFEEPRALIGARGAKHVVVEVHPRKGAKGGARAPGTSPHAAAIFAANDAGKRASEAGKVGQKSAKSYKASQHMPLVAVQRVGEVLGLALPKNLTPGQHASVKQHAQSISSTAKAVQRLHNASVAAAKAGGAATSFAKSAAPKLKKLLTGKPGTRAGVNGIFGDDPDPGAQPEPNAGAAPQTDPSVDQSNGTVVAPDGTVLYDPASDRGVIPMPQRGASPTQDDLHQIFQALPADAIPYQGGFGDQGAGSYSHYFNPVKSVGAYDGSDAPGNSLSWGPGFIWTRKGTHYGRDQQTPRWMFMRDDGSGQVDDPGDIGANETSANSIAAYSLKQGWGPLIGNPNNPDTAGLQYAVDAKQWFWQSQFAPAWAAAEADAKIMDANKKTIAANTAAAVVKAAQMAKDLADAAEARAKQEAAIALQQQKDEADQAHAQSQADAAATLQQQQQDAAQQKADLEAQVQQQKLDAQQQAANIAAQQRSAQAPSAGGGYGDGGPTATPDEPTDGGGEDDSAAEAQQIDSAGDQVVGNLGAVGGTQYSQVSAVVGDSLVGGDGAVIGVDDWGNVDE